MVQQEAEPLGGGAGRAEPGDLAPGPGPSAIHRRVRPAGERVGPREADVGLEVLVAQVLGGEQAAHVYAGKRLELLPSLRRSDQGLLQLLLLPRASSFADPAESVLAEVSQD